MSRLNIPDEDDDKYASNFHPGIPFPARMSRASFVPRQRFRLVQTIQTFDRFVGAAKMRQHDCFQVMPQDVAPWV